MGYKEEALDFLGITQWHKAGYKGKGIQIVSDELVLASEDVIAPKGFHSKRGHGDTVMEHIRMVAPEATLISYPFSGTFTTNTYDSKCADYIIANKCQIFTTSCSSGEINKGKEMAMLDCIDAGCIFFGAAGNKSSEIKGEIKSDKYYAIGGAKPYSTTGVYDWNRITRVSYSGTGKELDFVTLAEILGCNGTSFCSPVIAGMCALVQQFFTEKIGRRLTRAEMEHFMKANCIDLDTEGFDKNTGYGLFVLPDPDTIKISDYISEIHDGIDYSGFPEVRSDVEMRGIDKLHPDMQKACNMFLDECKRQGLPVLITETLRTQEEQERLYAQGRTTPGKIVTNCRGYQSPHCWGVSFDFCRNVKGKEYDNTDGFFERVGNIAKTILKDTEYRLFWGGDFKTFVDKPHVEMIKYLPNNSTKTLIAQYGTPENFMKTWNESEVEEMRYKTVEEMPEWARQPIQELIDMGALSGRGGSAGLDLSDDMVRLLIIAKKIYETPTHGCKDGVCNLG
jgi:peptidoglycan L-alanyl-D-glutamate endopeptidase CwlK